MLEDRATEEAVVLCLDVSGSMGSASFGAEDEALGAASAPDTAPPDMISPEDAALVMLELRETPEFFSIHLMLANERSVILGLCGIGI